MSSKYTNLPSETSAGDGLGQLALDVIAPGRHIMAPLWARLNPELWDLTNNPWAVLQSVSIKKLEDVTSDPAFRETLHELTERRAAAGQSWFGQAHPNAPLHTVAYFSMEYMLSEALPIYSGGLGNVAGDQLKAADDLGVPVTAIGLLYDQGYFRQEIDRNGRQRALYPYNDPGQLPIRPVRDGDGEWVRFTIPFPGGKLWIRTWEVQVGRTRLYLLDTNDPANTPEYRSITGELYGGGPELRLRQEHVLGIGGWQLLRLLGIHPEVCHLNEGHAAFAVLERAACYMADTGHPFEVALTVTRAGNLFTTHTAVEAGFDRFAAGLMYLHFGEYCESRLRIPFEQLMALGRRNAEDTREPFNMAYLALRGCGAVNGVSRLHGAVSRQLFQPLFPRWPTEEVPVGYVTNGVHMPTWDSLDSHRLWAEVCGSGCWHGDLHHMEARIQQTPDASFWRMRNASRKALIEYVRTRYARQVAMQGGSGAEIAAAGEVLDFNALTIGFARRFATYKRPNLLLHDPARLMRILGNSERRVQLIVAGKAHPQDGPGQDMIQQWNEFIRRLGLHPPVIFLSDYDMLLTARLVGGIDVWLNTPRRPWEASGTSGMKVLVNGGLNLSEIDGWWAEAYTPDVGWAIGDGREHGDDPAWDADEAEALYQIIEQQVLPEFYERNGSGIPARWVERMRQSMARLAPAFSANRTVREYTENHYLPGAAAYIARAAGKGKLGTDLIEWQRKLAAGWGGLGFGPMKVESPEHYHRYELVVYLAGLDPDSVQVEMFANPRNGNQPQRIAMNRVGTRDDGGFVYSASVETDRGVNDFTPRIIPRHEGAAVPLEANYIRWQR